MGPSHMGLRMLWPILMRDKCGDLCVLGVESNHLGTLAKLLNFKELVDFENKSVG
jgi:hypothetical protein